MSGTLLAIDVGTSRIRARLYSDAGKLLAEDARPTPVFVPEAGASELDVETLWRDVAAVVRSTISGHAPPAGVGVAAQLGTVVLDEGGAPLCPATLWADTRAAGEAEELGATLAAATLRVAGRRFTGEMLAPRLAWLRRRYRAAFDGRAVSVLSLKDFIVFRLTGALVTDQTHASYTGLFDIGERCWSTELMELAGLPSGILPPARPAGARAGFVTSQAGAETGLPAGISVAVGGPDGTLGAVGAGAISAGVAVDVAGSTDTVFGTVDIPPIESDGTFVVNVHAVDGLWTVGGPTGLTGGAVSWAARLGGADSDDAVSSTIAQALASVPPGCDGLLFRTALTGARFPRWSAAERGTIAGLSLSHGCLHLVRAALEGAAFAVADALDALRARVAVEEIIMVGGLAASPLALQLRADVLDVPIVTLADREASLAGAAMLAGVAAGIFADAPSAAATFVRRAGVVLPNPGARTVYRERRAAWGRLAAIASGAGAA